MKTKNIILASTAFVLAIGSAFGSLLIDTVYIHEDREGTPVLLECFDVEATCDEIGNQDCKVLVFDISQNALKPTQAYYDNECTDEVKDSNVEAEQEVFVRVE